MSKKPEVKKSAAPAKTSKAEAKSSNLFEADDFPQSETQPLEVDDDLPDGVTDEHLSPSTVDAVQASKLKAESLKVSVSSAKKLEAELDQIVPASSKEDQRFHVLTPEDLGRVWQIGLQLMDADHDVRHRSLLLDINLIEAWSDNPNVQDQKTYERLLAEIKDQYGDPELQDQAVHVCPSPDSPGRFIVFSGNHRTKAVRQLGGKRIRASLFFWSLQKVIEKAMVDNNLKGKNDPEKFTKLVNFYAERFKVDFEKIKDKFAFKNDAEFLRDYKRNKEDDLAKARDIESQGKSRSRDKTKKIEDLTGILNKLLREFGDTMDEEYIWFVHGGKPQLNVWMGDQLYDLMKKLTTISSERKVDVSTILTEILSAAEKDFDAIAVSKA